MAIALPVEKSPVPVTDILPATVKLSPIVTSEVECPIDIGIPEV